MSSHAGRVAWPEGSDDFLKFSNIIDGKAFHQSLKSYHSPNPWTGEDLWEAPVASERDVETAIKSALSAFPAWASLGYAKRRNLLLEWAKAIEKHSSLFIPLLHLEGGKPTPVAQNELLLTVSNIRKYAEYDVTQPEILFSDGRRITKELLPIGIALAITPSNFAILIAAHKICSGLIVGCPVIVKPSPFTPYSTTKIVELGIDIFPKGVLQALGGKDDPEPWLAQRLITDPAIDVISFTGSAATGKKVRIAAAQSERPKHLIQELGGNNPTIICTGVDIKTAAREVAEDILRNCGQVCVSSNRIYIPAETYDEFRRELPLATKAFVDAGLLGPIQNPMQYNKINTVIKDCQARKLNFLTGGTPPPTGTGFILNPTIIDNPPLDALVVKEECFGPIASIFPYTSLDEVIDIATGDNVNLAACVYTPDVETQKYIASKLKSGTIFVNSFARPKADVPLPGYGGSGMGNECGIDGVREFGRLRIIHH